MYPEDLNAAAITCAIFAVAMLLLYVIVWALPLLIIAVISGGMALLCLVARAVTDDR